MVADTGIPAGYKQTKVGVIPKDWKVKKLGEILKVKHGKSQRDIEEVDGKYPILATGGEIGRTNCYLYDKPSAMIGRKGTIDKPRYTESPFWTVDTLFYTDVFDNAMPKYVFYKFDTIDWYSYNEASGVPSLNAKTIENIQISLPPTVEEQNAIATVLSDTDALIERLEKLIAKKRNIKQGAMQQLLTGKKRLPGFGGEWEVKKFWEIFEITAGGDLDTDNFSLIQDEQFCYPIYSNALTNKGFYGYTSNYRQEENTITVTARGQVGVSNPRDHKYSAIGRVIILNPIIKLNINFISEYINTFIKFSNESTGVPQLTAPQISKYAILFPKPEEQNAIATILSDMDAEIENLEQKRDKYTMLKQGMMQQLLTGRIRIHGTN